MSRHREQARFYLVAPSPYLNRPARPVEDRDEVVARLAATVGSSRRQQLALELVERGRAGARGTPRPARDPLADVDLDRPARGRPLERRGGGRDLGR